MAVRSHVQLGVLSAIAIALILWVGRDVTFYADECLILSRDPSDPHAWLRPLNEHWMTVPFLPYVAVARVFGTSSYLPFQLLLMVVHVTGALSIYLLLRRHGEMAAVGGAALFLFLGSAYENLFIAIQLAFVGSAVLGLWGLLAVDRGRYAQAAVFLILSVASSGIGLPFVAGALAMAAMQRPGWRAAWLLLPVLGYGAWYLTYGREAIAVITNPYRVDVLVRVPGYVAAQLAQATAHGTGVPVVVAVAALAMLAAAFLLGLSRGWRPPALLTGALVGLLAQYAVVALVRYYQLDFVPRYQTSAAVFGFAMLGAIPLPRWTLYPLAALLIVALGTNLVQLTAGAAFMTSDPVPCMPS